MLCNICAYAEDLITIGGKFYSNITIREVTPCVLKIFHSSGAASIATGDIPDEFLRSHKIPFEKCSEFETDRQIALDERKFQDFIASNVEIVLPDGSTSNSSKIVGYDPIRVVFMFPGGPKGLDSRDLPESVRAATRYSDKAAEEFRVYLREQEIARNAQIEKYEEAQKTRKLEEDRQAVYKRLLRPSLSSFSSGSSGRVSVKGYYRKNGTYVRSHSRSRPR